MLLGNQEPCVKALIPFDKSQGEQAAILTQAYGLKPLEWQKKVLDVWLAMDDNKKFVSTRDGLLLPRQNGKNAVVEMFELYAAVVMKRHILHTAHEVRTSDKHFKRLLSFFDNAREFPDLAAEVENIRRANGQQAILLKNGAIIETGARTKGASRGFSTEIVVCDEAQYMTDEQYDAIQFTIAAASEGHSKVIFTGTPPTTSGDGEVFGRIRASALAHKERHTWLEWSCGSGRLCDIDISDRQLWADCNPSIGYILAESTIEDEFNSSSIDGFARERLSWWSLITEDCLIAPDDWSVCGTSDKQSKDDKKLAYGIKFSADGATVAVAGAISDGEKTHIELIHHESLARGLSWLIDWVAERKDEVSAIAVDGKANATEFAFRLKKAGISNKAIILLRGDDVIAATSMFVNAVREQEMTHYLSDGQKALDDSVLNATRRKIGISGGFGFGGANSEIVSSAALALWAVKTTKRKAGRKTMLL